MVWCGVRVISGWRRGWSLRVGGVSVGLTLVVITSSRVLSGREENGLRMMRVCAKWMLGGGYGSLAIVAAVSIKQGNVKTDINGISTKNLQ